MGQHKHFSFFLWFTCFSFSKDFVALISPFKVIFQTYFALTDWVNGAGCEMLLKSPNIPYVYKSTTISLTTAILQCVSLSNNIIKQLTYLYVWLTNILIRAFLTKTAEAELVCPWPFRSALTSSLSEALHQSLQLNIHHQKTGHGPFTLLVNEPASWIFLSSGLFTKSRSKKRIANSFKSFLGVSHLSFRLLSCLADPQRFDNTSTLLTSLMKVWHWFLNRPSLWSTVEPDAAALIQRLKLQATVFHCLIQLNMADTLTLHLNKQKLHIMISPAIMADWSDLVQGAVDLFSFMPI